MTDWKCGDKVKVISGFYEGTCGYLVEKNAGGSYDISVISGPAFDMDVSKLLYMEGREFERVEEVVDET